MPLDDDPESAASGSSRIRDSRGGGARWIASGGRSAPDGRPVARAGLKYLRRVKAWGRSIVAAAAVLLALAPAASASPHGNLHPRHIEFRPPTNRAFLYLGEHDGYELGIAFLEPDFAVLYVQSFDSDTQAGVSTAYGAHFAGSLAGGRVQARFGSIGSVAVRFLADGKERSGHVGKRCEGRRPRTENGHFVGRVALRGEGGYFSLAARRAGGSVSRTFQTRCRVKHPAPQPPPASLIGAVEPFLPFSIVGGNGSGGSLATLSAGERQGSRRVDLFARHTEGAPAGAEVTALAFEYQGKMPVGRSAWAAESPAGTLVTSLPGEHPPTATLKPAAPFTGEATYLASSHLVHSWTGDLSVQFPGLLQPLAGPEFFSTLCVVSSLRTRYGCDFLPPDWQPGE